jgi:hypothetical protein
MTCALAGPLQDDRDRVVPAVSALVILCAGVAMTVRAIPKVVT